MTSNRPYAFVHIEKTGGTSLNHILRRSYGSAHCDVRLPLAKRKLTTDPGHVICVDSADLRRVLWLYRNLRGISGHPVKPYANLNELIPDLGFITLVRDPTARFRSHFLNRSRNYEQSAFDDWCAEKWRHNWQTRMIAGEVNAEKAIDLIERRFAFVGLTERFDESLLLLKDWLGDGRLQTTYRPVNRLMDKRRPRDSVRARLDMSYLDSEGTFARLQEINAVDQQVYDYVLANIYPAQCQRYAGQLALDVRGLQEVCKSRLVATPEPKWSQIMRNFIYKPLLHARVV